jgi:hypothetical protein
MFWLLIGKHPTQFFVVSDMNDFDDRASLTSSLSSKSTSDIGDTFSTTLPTRIHRSPMKKLTLIVDKTRFICSTAIFQSQPETLLGKMFSAGLLKPGKKQRALLSSFQVCFFRSRFCPTKRAWRVRFYGKYISACFQGLNFAPYHLCLTVILGNPGLLHWRHYTVSSWNLAV